MSCATPQPSHFIPYHRTGSLLVCDALFTRICPSDLSNRLCEFDNLWRFDHDTKSWIGGCSMLRLCYNALNTKHRRPAFEPANFPNRCCQLGPASAQCAGPKGIDGLGTEMLPNDALSMKLKGWLHQQHPQHELRCPFLHGVDSTCTFLVEGVMKREVACPMAKRGQICQFGHDFEETRIRSLHSDRMHRQEAFGARNEVGVYWRDGWGRWWRRYAPRANCATVAGGLDVSNEKEGLLADENSDSEVDIICQ